MGLCKCPKKKVTNLFCFEHRVNVCEHCLVANHSKCIVKSYLQWLQDSDYNPVCAVCQRGLSDTECGDCVRLTCYDVFHWACINQFCQQLPSNTAPAGYTCPTCKAGIFPAQNLVSPVADELKKMLSQVNWARAGLGMPLIDEPAEQSKAPVPVQIAAKESRIPQTESTPVKENHISSLSNAAPLGVSPNHVASPSMVSSPNYTRPSAHVSPTQHSVINVDEGTSARGLDKSYDPRKLFDTTKEDTNNLLNLSHDHDENKYKRRSALEWLTKWLKSREGKHKRKDPQAVRKKFLMVLLIGVIGFITIIIIFSKLGRDAADDDPFLDPRANPNIRVNEQLGKQPID